MERDNKETKVARIATNLNNGTVRSAEANRKMWATLAQLCPVHWYGEYLTKEEWKDMITAGLKRYRVVPGIEGGFVVLGESTRKMSVAAMNEVIEYALWFGASKGIRFLERDEPSQPQRRSK